jgi:hypothetical protein
VPDVDWLVEKVQGFVDSGVLAGAYDRIWVNPGESCLLQTAETDTAWGGLG